MLRISLVLAFSLTYLVLLSASDITWSNIDADAAGFIWSTRVDGIGLIHPTGAPLYVGINKLITLDGPNVQVTAHRLALASAAASAVTATLLYALSRRIIAPMIFLGAASTVSQSTVPEMYALSTLFGVAIYMVRDTKWLFRILVILSLGTHHMVGLVIIPVLIYRWYKRGRLTTLVDVGFMPLAFLMYIPMILWFEKPPLVGWGEISWLKYFSSQSFMFMGLSPEDQGLFRLEEFIMVTLGGGGLAVFVTMYLWRTRFYTQGLVLALTVAPFIYYLTHLIPHAFVYTMMGFGFMGIFIAYNWEQLHPSIRKGMLANAVVLLAFNFYFLDIGRLDPSPTTARQFIESLEGLPEGSVVYSTQRGWETTTSWLSNSEVTVFAHDTEYDLEKITHVSILVDTRNNRSIIVPCSKWPTCLDGMERSPILAGDRFDEQTNPLLGMSERLNLGPLRTLIQEKE